MRILKQIKRRIYESDELSYASENGEVLDKNENPAVNTEINQLDKKIYFPYKKSKRDYMESLFSVAFKMVFNKDHNDFDDLRKMNIAESIIETGSQMMQFFHDFIQNDQRVVRFSNDALREQLENTELKDLKFTDLPMFFNVFYISVEKTVEGPEDGYYIDGIMVTNFKDSIKVCAPIIESNKEYGISSLNFYTVSITKGDKIETSIKEAISKCINLNEEGFEKFPEMRNDESMMNKKESNDTMDKIIMNYISKMAINTIFFYNAAKTNKDSLFEISANDERFKETFPVHKTNKAAKKFSKKVSDANFYYILKNNSEKNRNIEGMSKRGPIGKQFYVTGHYRHQPFGPKNTEGDEERKTRLVWIETYLKGTGLKESDKKMKVDVL